MEGNNQLHEIAVIKSEIKNIKQDVKEIRKDSRDNREDIIKYSEQQRHLLEGNVRIEAQLISLSNQVTQLDKKIVLNDERTEVNRNKLLNMSASKILALVVAFVTIVATIMTIIDKLTP